MLINCPRCGFSQPKDQYCASCGVNIEKYIPRKTSAGQKLLSSTLLQVVIVTGIALATAYLTLSNKNDGSISPSLTLRKKPTVSSLNSSSTTSTESPAETMEAEATEPDVSIEAQSEAQRNELAGASSETPPTATMATTEDTNSTDKAAAAQDTKKSITIKYSFYEVDRAVLAYWLQLNANQYPSDESSPFRIGEIKTELMHKQILAEPLKTETKKIVMNENESFSAGTARDNTDNFVGILSEFNLNEVTDASAKGLIRLTQKNSRGAEVTRVPLSVNKQNIFFVVWKNDILSFEAEPSVSQAPPFQILRSQRFRNHETEFVMIVEPFF